MTAAPHRPGLTAKLLMVVLGALAFVALPLLSTPAQAQVAAPPGNLVLCEIGTITTEDAFGGSSSISGTYGQGAAAVRFISLGIIPASVYINETSGYGNSVPNVTPGSAFIFPGTSYTFGYFGGLDYGDVRPYDWSVDAITPGFNELMGYEVYANRCS